ncbi:MAG TPA: thiamine phosphate synthase [Candidatus Acidoferrales bacterium]|jgi:thiamine-phosphate diphosphorylase|nr:thiamine phosphate synthase [Candidatus Acidoferrales bacterium]
MATHETARVTRAGRAALLHGVYLIVNEGEPNPVAAAKAGLAAGIAIVQYRAKRGIDATHLRALREETRERGALLIVNDDCDATIAFDADGVHLGPDDAGFDRVAAVRTMLGDRLIGLSCGTQAEARAAGDADYLGVGAVYATASKDDAGAPIGIDGLLAVARATHLPVAAIGGITYDTLADVRASGVAMAAVISAVANAHDPREAARALVARWNDVA